MKTIWKYVLKITDYQSLEIPRGGQMLTVQVQNNIPCIWVLVNPENAKEKVKIRTIGTGHPIEENFTGNYLGTYQMKNDFLVFHVFVE